MPKKRIYAYDLMRAVAIIMVVAVHCIPEGTSNAAHVYSAFMKALLFPCNAIFFLMSGMFNLKESNLENPSRYYFHKIRNILLPALIYMLINTVYDMVRQPGPFHPEALLRTFAVNAFSSYTNAIFWFVMSIFGMLLVAPFLARSFEHMDEKTAKGFLALLVIFSGLNLLGVCWGTGFGWPWPLSVFFSLFLLGPATNRIKKGNERIAAIVFLSCVVVSTILILNGVPHHPVNDNTPFYLIAGISLFVLLRDFGSRLKANKAVQTLSKYSFSIYMCHLLALPYITSILPPMTKPLAHLVLTASTLAVAMVVSVAVDNVVVKPLQRLIDRFYTPEASSSGHQD